MFVLQSDSDWHNRGGKSLLIWSKKWTIEIRPDLLNWYNFVLGLNGLIGLLIISDIKEENKLGGPLGLLKMFSSKHKLNNAVWMLLVELKKNLKLQ